MEDIFKKIKSQNIKKDEDMIDDGLISSPIEEIAPIKEDFVMDTSSLGGDLNDILDEKNRGIGDLLDAIKVLNENTAQKKINPNDNPEDIALALSFLEGEEK